MTQIHEMQQESAAPLGVDVFLVSFNSAHLLARLRETLERALQPDRFSLRLLAVDNASTDRSAEILRRSFRCDVLIQNKVNVGFGRANNQLLEHVRSPYVLLLNTDAFVSPDTIATTLDYMEAHPRTGILGVRLTDGEGGLQPSRRSFPTPVKSFLRRIGLSRLIPVAGVKDDIDEDHADPADCDWVPGCYYMVRREVLNDVGLFDPRFFLYYEEVDHCRRARSAGWTVTYLPYTSVVHVGGESARSVSQLSRFRQISELQLESELLYVRKHFGFLGLTLHMTLMLVGVFLMSLKDLLRRRGVASAMHHFRELRSSWAIARQTHFGLRATR